MYMFLRLKTLTSWLGSRDTTLAFSALCNNTGKKTCRLNYLLAWNHYLQFKLKASSGYSFASYHALVTPLQITVKSWGLLGVEPIAAPEKPGTGRGVRWWQEHPKKAPLPRPPHVSLVLLWLLLRQLCPSAIILLIITSVEKQHPSSTPFFFLSPSRQKFPHFWAFTQCL